MGLELVIDAAVLLLLAVLIVYSVILNNRLKRFRGAQQEMAAVVRQLNETTARAQESIATLKSSFGEEEARLSELLGKARRIADELSVMTDVGTALADRLEQGLAQGRTAVDQMQEPEEEKNPKPENDILKTLRNVR
ncbi:DUF6468 domain-containing protein [Luteithermobacter gelatinilyticus]|uniref:DUF6468 domain-containing protein n=1 Tax=Luteithermobacter gelatinilyticus TaxID=2582913 RepID=UPI00110576CB|nr:DUF6468 domain-containing protein [Luteithermobacter gelatinilyticus]|tara:strand:- start:12279 stop:12689 length:411 start_codon:yes stop_codon:yes gene_type:complete